MAIWISWNIDIWQSLNSRDSFPRRKFENRAPTNCRAGPILSLPTISFELHVKVVEEIEVQVCSYGQFSEVQMVHDLDLGLGQGQHTQYVQHYQHAQPCDYSITQYRNMAIWISWNIDIRRSLHSCDSFPRRTSCSPGTILLPTTISFELHAKTAEEIDLEKCNFRNFGSSVTLTLDRIEVTRVGISGQGLPTHQIWSKSEKLFVDVQMDTLDFQSIRSSPGESYKVVLQTKTAEFY